ncbi:MAG: hypothetical protein APR54_06830 [Candidatus Cloacimonas sp. SDB]|nr:MAG: hypothetical protein APR54_06830 [Candidatus Cloacimonas sp. SDB]
MKKKIVHLQVLPILSGVQKITLNIFRNLDPDLYEMFLICAQSEDSDNPSLISEAEKLGVKVIVLKDLKREIGLHDLKVFFQLLKIFRKYDFDIIHTHSSKTGFLGRIVGKLSGCKAVIHTVHGIAFHDRENFLNRNFYLILEIFAGFFNDEVILVNKYYQSKFWFIPRKKIQTIYNGIDLEVLKRKRNRNDDLIKLIFVGRLDRPKALPDLIRAFEICVKERNNIAAYIVGDGEYYDYLKEYIARQELGGKVKLLGWRFDVADLLADCDIFVGSSIYEAFGLVYCEAGYTGLPVVATRVEGIPEVILHNETGLLVEPGNPEALAKAVLQIADNGELAEAMGKAARRRVEENFSLTEFIRQYKEIYELY